MKHSYLIALLLAAAAILGTIGLPAYSASTNPAVDRLQGSDQGRLSNMACIRQLDQMGNFVKMLCLSPDPMRGGKVRYTPPARSDAEVWRELDRQKTVEPFWE